MIFRTSGLNMTFRLTLSISGFRFSRLDLLLSSLLARLSLILSYFVKFIIKFVIPGLHLLFLCSSSPLPRRRSNRRNQPRHTIYTYTATPRLLSATATSRLLSLSVSSAAAAPTSPILLPATIKLSPGALIWLKIFFRNFVPVLPTTPQPNRQQFLFSHNPHLFSYKLPTFNSGSEFFLLGSLL